MTIFSILLAFFVIVAIVCVAIAAVTPTYMLNGREWGTVFGILVVAAIGITLLVFAWDDLLVRRADAFMLTRDATYACTDMGPSTCKKSILGWQKDSTWYANKVSNILNNIKETK